MINITPLERRYQQAVDDLLFRNYQVHTHLDWQDVTDWLHNGAGLVRLAWQGPRLMGVLGVAAPLNRTSWFRLAAVHDRASGGAVMAALWEVVAAELRAQGTESVSVLVTRAWVEQHVAELGFSFSEEIITLRRDGDLLPPSTPHELHVRLVTPADYDDICQLDHRAFEPPWQLSSPEMRLVGRVAVVFTVALLDERIIGYQVCTLYRDGAHLARLAVDPECQGQGVGRVLLADVLARFFRRRVYTMTVNTQESNLRSRRLYTRFGFQRNGYDLPVWTIRL